MNWRRWLFEIVEPDKGSSVANRIYNVSRLDERYEIVYEPTWVEI